MGVSTDPRNFVTASTASASWLQQHAAGKIIYVLGTRSLILELEGHGIRVTTNPDDPDISFVLAAYDSELTYQKLSDTCRILQTRPVTFLATNPDLVCPVPFGYVPDCGSICQMITNATGQVPVISENPLPIWWTWLSGKIRFPKRKPWWSVTGSIQILPAEMQPV